MDEQDEQDKDNLGLFILCILFIHVKERPSEKEKATGPLKCSRSSPRELMATYWS
jgi:hypothetical protein